MTADPIQLGRAAIERDAAIYTALGFTQPPDRGRWPWLTTSPGNLSPDFFWLIVAALQRAGWEVNLHARSCFAPVSAKPAHRILVIQLRTTFTIESNEGDSILYTLCRAIEQIMTLSLPGETIAQASERRRKDFGL